LVRVNGETAGGAPKFLRISFTKTIVALVSMEKRHPPRRRIGLRNSPWAPNDRCRAGLKPALDPIFQKGQVCSLPLRRAMIMAGRVILRQFPGSALTGLSGASLYLQAVGSRWYVCISADHVTGWWKRDEFAYHRWNRVCGRGTHENPH
jgi:hypothetical protein